MYRRGPLAFVSVLCCLGLYLAGPAVARADVFNGRIGFSSDRAEPPAGVVRSFDIFSMNADGSDVRRLTTNPDPDRQSDWSPDGRNFAYSIRRPGATSTFESARMTALGTGYRQLTTSPEGQSSTQPSWRPDGKGMLFRRSGPTLQSGSIWQMGPLGEMPAIRFGPPHNPLYPAWSPDMKRVLFAAIVSPTGNTDRGIFTLDANGSNLTTLFDVPGGYDSGPAWSPDGRRIAFETDADVGGGNPEGDMEIWTMAADGSDRVQLTRNAIHDEGPVWRPDGKVLAYTSGPDERHGDIHLMTAAGRHLRTLTSYAGPDESPDWQAIPAPRTARRCGGLGGRGVVDVRAGGRGLRCPAARALARRWAAAGGPARMRGFRAVTEDFGGVRRVVLRRGDVAQGRVVAFLQQR